MVSTKIDRVTTDEEIAWLREVYDMLFSGEIKLLPGALVTDVMTRMDQQRGDRIGQVLRPEQFIPELKKTQFLQEQRGHRQADPRLRYASRRVGPHGAQGAAQSRLCAVASG